MNYVIPSMYQKQNKILHNIAKQKSSKLQIIVCRMMIQKQLLCRHHIRKKLLQLKNHAIAFHVNQSLLKKYLDKLN